MNSNNSKYKKISIIGIGRLGICLSLNLEEKGYDVLGLDINENYIDSINKKTLISSEPYVESMLKKSKNFIATTKLEEVLSHSNIIFIVLPTPSLPDGKYNHSYIEDLIERLEVIGPFEDEKSFIICSTTMPGYCKTVHDRLGKINCKVSYNPEFIAQGSIINNQKYPDIVLIGSEDLELAECLSDIYKQMCENNPKIYVMDIVSAEIAKLALNCFVTTKIAYANMVGDVCKKIGADENKVLECIGEDSRVGKKYLNYGFGYGGPCFPRDNRAFYLAAKENGIEATISQSTDISNELHLKYQVEDFVRKNKNLKEFTFGPISYKPNTDIIEESQQLLFAIELSKHFSITIEDSSKNIEQVKKIYGDKFKYKII
jgi:nucleotide sugar dehydrogenase